MTAILLRTIRKPSASRYRGESSRFDRRRRKNPLAAEPGKTAAPAPRAHAAPAREPEWQGQWRLLKHL